MAAHLYQGRGKLIGGLVGRLLGRGEVIGELIGRQYEYATSEAASRLPPMVGCYEGGGRPWHRGLALVIS